MQHSVMAGAGGVPVGAWNNQGYEPVANSVQAVNQGVPAPWASDIVLAPSPTHCEATTKKGAPCGAKRVNDEDGNSTELCVGHWSQVLAAFPPEVAGGQ